MIMSALSQSNVYENAFTAQYLDSWDLLPLDLSTKKTTAETRLFQSPISSTASQAQELANSIINHARTSPSPCGSESGRSFSSCCSRSPSPISSLRNDDSGYAEPTDSTELLSSSYWSPLAHLQIELDGVFDDVLEDITSDVKSSSLRISLDNKESIHAVPYMYVTASKGAKLPEKRRHQRQRQEETKHECQLCGERLATRSNLIVHTRRHTGQKPYECEFCGKRFTQRSGMRTHLRTHTNERPYACTACPKTFRDYSTFTKHYRIHTGQRPYSCKFCGKAFAQSGNLNRHLTTHRNHTMY